MEEGVWMQPRVWDGISEMGERKKEETSLVG